MIITIEEYEAYLELKNPDVLGEKAAALDESNVAFGLNFSPEYTPKTVVDLGELGYKVFMDYNDICFGQFVLFENMIKHGKGVVEMLSVFIRPEAHETFNNTNPNTEDEIQRVISKIRVGSAFTLLNNLISQREHILFKQYRGAIYSDNSEEDEEDGVVQNVNEFEVKFNEIWFWYERQKSLSKEFRMPMDDVLMLNVHKCLTEIAYQTHKQVIETRKNRRTK